MKREYSPENVTITIAGHEIVGWIGDEVEEELRKERGMVGRTILIVGDFSGLEERIAAKLLGEKEVSVGCAVAGCGITPGGSRFWDSFCELPRPMIYERVKLPHTQRHGPRDKWGGIGRRDKFAKKK